MRTLADRFWSKVDRRSIGDCWPWKASRQGEYGQIYFQGRPIKAQRVSWLLAHGGELPKLHVRHTCDNPICVNPSHLVLGTHRDNMHDKLTRDRQQRGSRCYNAKLNARIVRRIRKLWATGEYLQCEIAELLGIKLWNVKSVVQRKTWVHV